MVGAKRLLRCAMAMAMIAGVASSAGATTLIRASLDDLVTTNDTIVVGEVLDAFSYWNEEGTFILTDVRLAVVEVLKGRVRDRELTVTLMGGTVGELTTLIVGGAELAPERSYVLFLNGEDLPGVKGARTVRDHCQGAFDVVKAEDGLRAVSQASRHPLAPDALGKAEAPGGVEGIPFGAMIQSIREIADGHRGTRKEVK